MGRLAYSVERRPRLGVIWWAFHVKPSEFHIFAVGRWERRALGIGQNASRVGQEWDKRGSSVGQYWASWIMRATSGGSRAGQELAPSWSIVGHAWPQSRPSIDRCCAIDVPKGGSGVGQWLVKSGSQANYERGTPGPPGHPRAAHPQTWGIAVTPL